MTALMARIRDCRWILVNSALLSGLTLAVFWPASRFEFQAYDDPAYVTSNLVVKAGLTRQGLAWAFGFHASNWHPLTWISHMLDAQFFGMNPGAHHLVNVGLHIANAVLLLLVLKRMTGALLRSSFVAALFALHPMHVESVAWIAERKDVLSTFFFMLTLLTYAGYVASKVHSPGANTEQEGASNGSRARMNYLLAIVFYAFGLLSKPMLVTLPFVLLLLDYWPLRRFQNKRERTNLKNLVALLQEKIPFFLLAICSSVVTFLAQRSGGAVASLQLFSFDARIANALAAYAGYLDKLIWPANLAVLYLPPAHWPVLLLMTVVVIVGAITALAVWQRSRRPYIIVGWLWFLGTLVPVIGLVQVGSQYMADRYSYVPFIGCFIALSWGGWDFIINQTSSSPKQAGSEPLNIKRRPNVAARGSLWAAALLLIGAAAVLAGNQLQYWRTPEALFRHCLKVTTDNYIAYNNLGAILVNQGKYDEARPLYTEALRINSRFRETWINMGALLAIQGDPTNAVEYLEQAVGLLPKSAEAYGKLAVALSAVGRIPEAVSAYRESLRLGPDQVPACNNLAWILATNPDPQLRDGSEAVRLAEHACGLTDYKQAQLIGTLAAAYAEAGRFSEASRRAEEAMALANASGKKEIALKNQELKALYDARQPFREEPK